MLHLKAALTGSATLVSFSANTPFVIDLQPLDICLLFNYEVLAIQG